MWRVFICCMDASCSQASGTPQCLASAATAHGGSWLQSVGQEVWLCTRLHSIFFCQLTRPSAHAHPRLQSLERTQAAQPAMHTQSCPPQPPLSQTPATASTAVATATATAAPVSAMETGAAPTVRWNPLRCESSVTWQPLWCESSGQPVKQCSFPAAGAAGSVGGGLHL